jgi:hypothetical protein
MPLLESLVLIIAFILIFILCIVVVCLCLHMAACKSHLLALDDLLSHADFMLRAALVTAQQGHQSNAAKALVAVKNLQQALSRYNTLCGKPSPVIKHVFTDEPVEIE